MGDKSGLELEAVHGGGLREFLRQCVPAGIVSHCVQHEGIAAVVLS